MTVSALASPHRITVMQGKSHVASGRETVLTTVLGSCVAACLFDAEAGIGGMNHFLLAEPMSTSGHTVDEHYGVYLMELLINGMLQGGAAKHRMRAHLYGGANLHAGMRAIGTMNADFARSFLRQEGITLTHADLGGTRARRVEFMPALGRARCRLVEGRGPAEQKPIRALPTGGDVELF
ncbi:chemotaxis protein CheD [Sphingomonas morindae]|uniref:Probable chemoreceptor glutamine deamidase CheD n=1 Tax=Sphingomonas morindae TaxID=1541170 RepID=A0ABY4X4A1_9SPHN|nr:chemotaxis protein CheD [Sphingomonas morindae]USI71714.1 chemotaxis protein CheD [Sphingomonas morindae]